MKKKIILFYLLLCCGFTLSAQNDNAQPIPMQGNTKVKKMMPDALNNIKLNLLSPFYGNLSFFYQRVINPDYSLQLGVSYMDFSGTFGNSSNSTGNSYAQRSNEITNMFTLTPEFRYNLTGQNLSGVYFGSFLRYMNMKYSYDLEEVIQNPSGFGSTTVNSHTNVRYNSLGIGVLVGTQVLYKRKITFDVYGGPVYSILLSSSIPVASNNDIIKSDEIPGLFIRGYGFRAGITVGYAF